jgi:hypothetical protein
MIIFFSLDDILLLELKSSVKKSLNKGKILPKKVIHWDTLIGQLTPEVGQVAH